MNKKGEEGVKLIMYYAGGLLIGIIVLSFLVIQLPKIFIGNTEDIMAKDLALTIMTISASPTDMVVQYTENTENYEVRVSNNEVKVKSDKASGKYAFYSMRGIIVADAIITKRVSIPIKKQEAIISFEGDEDFTDACSMIPLSDYNANIEVKILISDKESAEAKQILNQISEGFKLRASSDNSRITITNEPDDELVNVVLVLKTSSGNDLNIDYYQDLQKPDTASYRRLACYLQKAMKDYHSDIFNEIKSTSTSDQNTITFDFGDPANLQKNKDFGRLASKEIYDTLLIGLTK